MNGLYGLKQEPWCPEPPADKIFCHCKACGGEIYQGCDYYDISGFGIVCEECISNSFHSEAGY